MADPKTRRKPKAPAGATDMAAPIRLAAADLEMTEEPSSFASALELGAAGGATTGRGDA